MQTALSAYGAECGRWAALRPGVGEGLAGGSAHSIRVDPPGRP